MELGFLPRNRQSDGCLMGLSVPPYSSKKDAARDPSRQLTHGVSTTNLHRIFSHSHLDFVQQWCPALAVNLSLFFLIRFFVLEAHL
jgi:hypothetical protein